MKAVVDTARCEANGKCELVAPDVFVLGDEDVARVRVDEVPAELIGQAERAIRVCPRQAIGWNAG